MRPKPFDALSPIPTSERIEKIERLGDTLDPNNIESITSLVGLEEQPYIGRELVAIAGIRAIRKIICERR